LGLRSILRAHNQRLVRRQGEARQPDPLGAQALHRRPYDGWFYQPTIFTGVRSTMRIAQEEIFGPVLSVIPFAGDDDAVQIANDVLYGLTAAIRTRDISRAHSLARRIDAGVIFVNTMNDGRGLGSPVSGWKQSGMSVENGLEGLLACTRLKSVIINTGNPTPSL
jgi:acyl-CoA reductase-like NAD-dependent aldehyde dehydrogenase